MVKFVWATLPLFIGFTFFILVRVSSHFSFLLEWVHIFSFLWEHSTTHIHIRFRCVQLSNFYGVKTCYWVVSGIGPNLTLFINESSRVRTIVVLDHLILNSIHLLSSSCWVLLTHHVEFMLESCWSIMLSSIFHSYIKII